VDFRVGQVHSVSKPMFMDSYSDSLNGSAILNNGGSEEYIVNHISLNILYHVFGQDVFLYNCPLKYFLCMFLFALLDKFAVRVLINKCSPLTYIIFWLFSCACFN